MNTVLQSCAIHVISPQLMSQDPDILASPAHCKQKYLVRGCERSWLPSWVPEKETPTECSPFPVPRSLNPKGFQIPSCLQILLLLPSPWSFKAWSWLLSPGWVNAQDEGRSQLHPFLSKSQWRTPTLSLASLCAGEDILAGAPGGSRKQILQLSRERKESSPIIHQSIKNSQFGKPRVWD